MTASDLIAQLTSLMERHGDLPVIAGGTAEGVELEHAEYNDDEEPVGFLIE